MEVQWTGDLSYFASFLPLEPLEVRRTGQSSQSDNFLLQSDFTGLSPDLDWTSSGIWSSPTDSVGSLTDCPAESIGIGWVQSKSVGIHWKRGGSVKYTNIAVLRNTSAKQCKIFGILSVPFWPRRRHTN